MMHDDGGTHGGRPDGRLRVCQGVLRTRVWPVGRPVAARRAGGLACVSRPLLKRTSPG